MSVVSIDEVDLHVVLRGKGTPLLLVHGFPLDHQMWRAQYEDLSQGYRVIVPDLRGFGESDVSPGTVTMERFADDLAELLDRLGITEPVALCGLSMGGYVAWQFWRRHTSRLSHLILCDTRAAADSGDASRQRYELADRVLNEGTSILAEGMIPKLFADNTRRQHAETIAAVEQVIRSAQPVGLASALRGMAQREDVTPRLKEMDIPSLVLCGQEDVISTVTEMQTIAEAMPCSEFVVVPRCGHMAPMENPIHVNKAIRGFLSPL